MIERVEEKDKHEFLFSYHQIDLKKQDATNASRLVVVHFQSTLRPVANNLAGRSN